MVKETHHPNAYLSEIKNINLGLRARTQILNVLEKSFADARTIAQKAQMHYGVVMHHLKLLEAEAIIQRKGTKPYTWFVTGLGQKRLANSG